MDDYAEDYEDMDDHAEDYEDIGGLRARSGFWCAQDTFGIERRIDAQVDFGDLAI